MTDCDGEPIGRIRRLGHRAERELKTHHLLDLRLAAAPVARDGLLHLGGRVLKDWDSPLRNR